METSTEEPPRPISPRDCRAARRMVQALGTRSPDTDDLAQEVLIVLSRRGAVFEAREHGSPEQAQRAFLFEVTTRITANHRRKCAQHRASEHDAATHVSDDAAPSAEDLALGHGARRLLREAIEEMERSEPTLHAVLALHLGEASTPQIAAQLGLLEGTVSTRLRLARAMVIRTARRRLAQDEGHAQLRTFRGDG